MTRIKLEPADPKFMPKGGKTKLADDKVKALEQWQSGGTPEKATISGDDSDEPTPTTTTKKKKTTAPPTSDDDEVTGSDGKKSTPKPAATVAPGCAS